MSSPISHLLSASPIDWHAVLDAVVADFAGATGTLHRVDPTDGLLKVVAHRGIPPQLLPVIVTIPIGKGIAGVAAERREPVELCNLQQDLGGVAKEGARATNVQGSLAVPCLYGEELRGTLGVGLSVPHDFTEEEKARLIALGREMAASLNTAMQ
jgi:L-methionine (R)-S-oxide reductase